MEICKGIQVISLSWTVLIWPLVSRLLSPNHGKANSLDMRLDLAGALTFSGGMPAQLGLHFVAK